MTMTKPLLLMPLLLMLVVAARSSLAAGPSWLQLARRLAARRQAPLGRTDWAGIGDELRCLAAMRSGGGWHEGGPAVANARRVDGCRLYGARCEALWRRQDPSGEVPQLSAGREGAAPGGSMWRLVGGRLCGWDGRLVVWWAVVASTRPRVRPADGAQGPGWGTTLPVCVGALASHPSILLSPSCCAANRLFEADCRRSTQTIALPSARMRVTVSLDAPPHPRPRPRAGVIDTSARLRAIALEGYKQLGHTICWPHRDQAVQERANYWRHGGATSCRFLLLCPGCAASSTPCPDGRVAVLLRQLPRVPCVPCPFQISPPIFY